jgi:hypothetical protein
MAEPVARAAPSTAKTPLENEGLMATVNASPTLKEQLKQLKKDDWKIRYTSGGVGSSQNGIVRIPRGSDEARLLAHEVGHATSGLHPDQCTMDRKTFVDTQLKSEGAAVINTIKVQREVDLGSPITPGLINHDRYNDIYDNFKAGKITEDDARTEIGKIYRNGEYIEVASGEYVPYGEIYGQMWDNLQGNCKR